MTTAPLLIWLLLSWMMAPWQGLAPTPGGLKGYAGGGGGTWTYRTGNGTGGGATSSTTVATTLTGIASGDTIACTVKWEGTTTTVSVSDGTSSFTQTVAGVIGINEPFESMHYLISSSATGSVTYTATFGAARPWKSIVCQAYSHTGSTPVLDGTATGASGVSTTCSSGNTTTAGTSGLAFGAYGEYGASLSSPLINGAAASQTTTAGSQNDALWSKTYSSGFTGAATGTLNFNNYWDCQILTLNIP